MQLRLRVQHLQDFAKSQFVDYLFCGCVSFCSCSNCFSFFSSISFSFSFDSFGNRKAICIRMLQGDVPAGYTALPKNWAWRFAGWNPSFMMRPKPAPKGTVQTFPLVAVPASSF